MSGHWSEKARNEAELFGEVKEVAVDPKGRARWLRCCDAVDPDSVL